MPVDLTFNGQDYLRGRDLRFIYSQRDEYKWNSSCLNQWGQVTEGMDVVDQLAKGEPPRNPDRIVSMKVAADA